MDMSDYVRVAFSEAELSGRAPALSSRERLPEHKWRLAAPDERQRVGLEIDADTADIFFLHAQILDPYGDDPNLPDEFYNVGRAFFAFDPKVGIAVEFGDLPENKREALWAKRDEADREGWQEILSVTRTLSEEQSHP